MIRRFPATGTRPRRDIGSSANYNENAANAFAVAEQLASTIAAIPGQKTIMAHSLGNMVVSSMIQDHGLTVSKYLMCNSAVPVEAYDPDPSLRVPQLVHPDWEEYPTNTWTASYHSLFDDFLDDDRRLLGWPGRFADVAQYAVNFYSTGDEVLEILDDNDIGLLDGITSMWVQYSWHHQEMRADPVFNPYPASITNSVIPLLVRSAHLTKGIPALTLATGRTAFVGDLYVDNMVNLNDATKIERPNSWPQGRRYGSQWTHSDMKNVAYYFNFGNVAKSGMVIVCR